MKWISQLPLSMISLRSRPVLDFKPLFLMDVNAVSVFWTKQQWAQSVPLTIISRSSAWIVLPYSSFPIMPKIHVDSDY